MTRIMDTLYENACKFMITSRWVILKWECFRHIFSENRFTSFVFNKLFPEICVAYKTMREITVKPDRPQMTKQ